MAINFVSPGDYMISLDLKDAYFSVLICISFVETRDMSLPAYLFTKNLKPFVSYLRLNGLRIVIFFR